MILVFIAGCVICFGAGVLGGYWISRGRVARLEERVRYAARELDRRKMGATRTDLRMKGST
jgi:hypothetical protein